MQDENIRKIPYELRQGLEKLRRELVDNDIKWQFAEPETADYKQHSYYRSLLTAISESALVYVLEKNADRFGGHIDEFDLKHEAESEIYVAIEVLSDLKRAFPDKHDEGGLENLDFWQHERSPLNLVKWKKTPRMSRNEIEYAVGRYLDLPYRSAFVDRQLVDILVGMELYAFADQMLNPFRIWGMGLPSPIRQMHILPSFVLDQVVTAAFLSIPYFMVAAMVGWGWVSPNWATAGAYVCGGLFVLYFMWCLIHLPTVVRARKRARAKTYELLDSVCHVYAELDSSGPISPAHIRQSAERAGGRGVVWPAPLFALLDDIQERAGRF